MTPRSITGWGGVRDTGAATRTLCGGLVAFLLGGLLLGCGSDPSPGTTVVVLFDLSESTNSLEGRRAYCDNFQRALSHVGHGDAIAVAWITESSATEARLAVHRRFPHFDPRTTNDMLAAARKAEADSALSSARDSLQEVVCEALLNPERRVLNTDIMTSLDLAQRIFRQEGNLRDTLARNLLVIMSDMIEDSDRYDFDTLSLSEERIEEIVRREREERRLADLTGVGVCVVGASGSGDRYHRIRRFWTGYFQATGARLLDYGGPYVGCGP